MTLTHFVIIIDDSRCEMYCACGSKSIGEFFFFFLIKWLFWVVFNILSSNELKKKKSWVHVRFEPGALQTGVRRSTD